MKKQAVTKSVKGKVPYVLDVMEQNKAPVFKSDVKEYQHHQDESGKRPDLVDLEKSMSFAPVHDQKKVEKPVVEED